MPNARFANVVLVRAVDGSAEAVAPVNQGALRYHTANKEWQQSSDGAPWLPLVPSFTRMFYVDAGTVVPVAQQTGSVSKPYSTIQAAITAGAAVVGGFCVWVTPGNYAENIVLPDHDNMSIVGQDAASTILSEAAPGHTISWVPAAITGPGVHRFMIEGMTIKNASAGFDTFHVDGSACPIPVTFMDTDAELRSLRIEKTGAGAAVFLRCAGRFYPRICTLLAVTAPSKALDVSNVTTLAAQTCVLNGPSTLEFDPAAGPRPATGRNAYAYLDETTDFYDVPAVPVGFRTTLKGSPIFVVDETSVVIGEAAPVVGPLAVDGGPGLLVGSAAPLHQPVVILNGTFGRAASPGSGNVTLALPPDPGLTVSFVDLSRGTFNGNVVLSRTVAPAALPPVCFGRGATFTKTAAASVSVTTVLAIVLNLDIRDCAIVQAALSTSATAGASIDRSKHFIFTAGPLGLGPNPIAIVPPFPATAAGLTGYQVSTTCNTVAIVASSVTAKTSAGFTVNTAAPGAGYDFLVSRVE